MTNNSDVHAEMLRNFFDLRYALGQQFHWYCHVTPCGNFDSIKQHGLDTKSDASPPAIVTNTLGAEAQNIICINPLGSDLVPPAVQDGPFICLGFKNCSLPKRLGLDWSYQGCVGLAQGIRNNDKSRGPESIFVEVAKKTGSIVSYDSIPPENLRVFAKSSLPHSVTTWPMLSDTALKDVQIVGQNSDENTIL